MAPELSFGKPLPTRFSARFPFGTSGHSLEGRFLLLGPHMYTCEALDDEPPRDDLRVRNLRCCIRGDAASRVAHSLRQGDELFLSTMCPGVYQRFEFAEFSHIWNKAGERATVSVSLLAALRRRPHRALTCGPRGHEWQSGSGRGVLHMSTRGDGIMPGHRLVP